MKTSGILLLAGNSTRYNKNINKNLEMLNKQYVFLYSLNVFNKCNLIDNIIMIIRKEDKMIIENIISKLNFSKSLKLVFGGDTRMESVYNAITNTDSDIVVIHDAARPLIKEKYISDGLLFMNNYNGAITGIMSKDTIKITNDNKEIMSSTKRNNTFIAQTPQIFNRKLLLKLHEKYQNDTGITDDAMLLEKENYLIKIIDGDYTNIKITTKEDFEIAKQFLKII